MNVVGPFLHPGAEPANRGAGDGDDKCSQRRLFLRSAGAVAVCASFGLPSRACAQSFPTHPLHLILPQPPGGAADRLARIVAEELEARLRQPVIVEYKPGGGVVVGTLATVRSAADGYTFALLGSSLSINAVRRQDLPYDALKDLQPLAFAGYYTMALIAAESFPADDIKGLLALARQSKPGSLFFGSNGIGTSAQLAGEMLNQMAAIDMQHIPYNGASKMYTDILGGRLALGFAVASSAEGFIKAGKLKVLGVTSLKRSQMYPDWPSIAETLPGFDVVNWAGFMAPSGVPPETARIVSDAILAALRAPEVLKSMLKMGIEPSPRAPAEFETFLRAEIERFSKLTKSLGAHLQQSSFKLSWASLA